MSTEVKKKDLGSDLLKDFHMQFAQNQNHHQTTVITVITAFVALISVFAYATLYQEKYLVNTKVRPPYIVSDELYGFLAWLLCVLFVFAYVYVCQVGYAFRRDQAIVNRIRKDAGIHDTIFGGYGATKGFWFLPDFYVILLVFMLFATVLVDQWTRFILRQPSVTLRLFLCGSVMTLSYAYYERKYQSKISCTQWTTRSEKMMRPLLRDGVLVIVVLICLGIGGPIIVEQMITGMSPTLTWGEWATFLGSYWGGLLGGGATLLAIVFTVLLSEKRDRERRKMANRAFLMVESIDSLGPKLEGYQSGKDVRILETENYRELCEYLKTNKIPSAQMEYIRCTNPGPGFVTDCTITLTVIAENNAGIREIKANIPLFQVNQEYFVFSQSVALSDYPQLVRSIEIEYTTTEGERMRYLFQVQHTGSQRQCIEEYFVLENNKWNTLIRTQSDPMSWIYPSYTRTL